MYLIVGLGNPTKEYENTRHNIGFAAVDMIGQKYGIDIREKKHKALFGKGMIKGEKVVLAKPQTFMNLSGESVRQLIDYYKIDETIQMIVLYDAISLEPGQVRIRVKGSAGGHNGIKSILLHLGHDHFTRIKIGVGEKPKGYDLADYVLGHFKKDEKDKMNLAIEDVLGAVEVMIDQTVDCAMNQYNKKRV